MAADPIVVLETLVRANYTFDIKGRGRLRCIVVKAGHIPFVVALGGVGRELWVGSTRVERVEVPHVSGAADAFGSFYAFDTADFPNPAVGERVTVVRPATATDAVSLAGAV